MGWCMENCKCHSYLHRHCWTSEIKKSEAKALHVGYTNSLPQAVVSTGDVEMEVRVGGRQGIRHDVCSFFLCVIPKGQCIFTSLPESNPWTLLLAFASH